VALSRRYFVRAFRFFAMLLLVLLPGCTRSPRDVLAGATKVEALKALDESGREPPTKR
jgi:hypothetical protein